VRPKRPEGNRDDSVKYGSEASRFSAGLR